MIQAGTDATADEAAAWIARMDGVDWDANAEASLEAWLAGEPRRRGALLQLQALWEALDAPAVATPGMNRGMFADPNAPLRVHRRALMIAGGGVLAAALVAGFAWRNAAAYYATQLGEIRKVPLADGSSATINSASEIEVRIAAQRRDVRIARGEAWFQVAQDRARPFVVSAGAVRVEAVGTAFSVRRRATGADILLTEGTVEAWAETGSGLEDGEVTGASDGTIRRVRLTAGQRIYIGDDAAFGVVTARPSEVDAALAWRAGLIDLHGRSLADALVEFNRYNRRKLVLTDQALAAEQFDGLFRTDDPAGFAAAVHESFGVAIDDRDAAVIRIGGSEALPST